MINTIKLSEELRAAGITTHGNCNSNGIVWDDNNNEIQKRPDVAAVIAVHNPLPDNTTLNAIIATAQSAVGVKLADLTATQIKSLIACLLYQVGGVDLKTMAVKPLADWVK